MASNIVGLMGKAGSGKDTFAERLVARHGYTRVAFADAVKGLALCVDPLIQIDHALPVRLSKVVATLGWDGAKAIFSVRALLQDIGCGVRDYVGKDAWLRAAINKIESIPGPVVVTDVRFANEADWIDLNGTLIRITRPSLRDEDRHVSENELNDRRADHVVVNSSTLTDLHVAVDLIATHIPSGVSSPAFAPSV